MSHKVKKIGTSAARSRRLYSTTSIASNLDEKPLGFASLELGYEEIKFKYIASSPLLMRSIMLGCFVAEEEKHIFRLNQIRYFHTNPRNLNNKESSLYKSETLTVTQKVLSSNKMNSSSTDLDEGTRYAGALLKKSLWIQTSTSQSF